MQMEDRVRQVAAFPLRRLGDRALARLPDVFEHEGQRLVEREDRDDVCQVAQRDRLVQRDAESGRRQGPEVDLPGPRRIEQARQGPLRYLDAERVEEVV